MTVINLLDHKYEGKQASLFTAQHIRWQIVDDKCVLIFLAANPDDKHMAVPLDAQAAMNLGHGLLDIAKTVIADSREFRYSSLTPPNTGAVQILGNERIPVAWRGALRSDPTISE